VKGFANACYKDEEGVAEGVVSEGVALEGVACHKDREDEQRRKEIIASLIKVELRQL
jgi:hypothetical protein